MRPSVLHVCSEHSTAYGNQVNSHREPEQGKEQSDKNREPRRGEVAQVGTCCPKGMHPSSKMTDE
jgi:hypothetical protein